MHVSSHSCLEHASCASMVMHCFTLQMTNIIKDDGGWLKLEQYVVGMSCSGAS